MTLTISIQFLTGRAHMHHWHAHHSDGKVDWPPSPWRLLRALVAVAGRGLTTLPHWDDTPPEPKLMMSDMISLKKNGLSKGAKGKISFSRKTQDISLKELLTDEEVTAYKKANPLPDFAAVLEKLQSIVMTPDPIAMNDTEGDELPISQIVPLLSVLAETPEIWLPKTSGGHTRQFFPIHEGSIVKPSGSAVFDTFAVVSKNQPVFFHWPNVDFVPTDQRLLDLQRILRRMTYFGRAESWCQAEATVSVPISEFAKTHWPCVCIEDGGNPKGREYLDYTLERKLAALPHNELADEARRLMPHTRKLNANRSDDNDFGALLNRESDDKLLLRCLMRESGQDMKDGLERPIGSRWVHYAVQREIFNLPRPSPQKVKRREEYVQLVRYSLNTASVHRPVLPLLTDTLLVADKFRSAALSVHNAIYNGGKRPHCRNLVGREEDGTICKEHDHAFFWPTDEDNDGFIDHVTVYCPRGFESHEVDALRRLCRITQRGGRPDLLVTPVYIGEARMFRPWQPNNENGDDCRSRIFVSITPYFCPVHLSHGKGSSGRTRPITPQIIKSMVNQRLISSPDDVTIKEIVFDYSPRDLEAITADIAEKKMAEPVPPRQYFPVIEPPSEYPQLPHSCVLTDQRYMGAFLKEVDSGFPFGLSVGLMVNEGTRFVRAMSFCRRRRNHEVKGYGRMFLIEFSEPRAPRPFAIGNQCHFGLGLFAAVD